MLGIVRYLWASPNTALGLVLVAGTLASRGRATLRDGVIETHGGLATLVLRRLVPLEHGASAMTIGHVVIGRDAAALERTRDHERVHVRQYERWGPLFLPAYFAGAALAWWRGGDAYRDNPFEREAFERELTTAGTPPPRG